MPFFALAVWLRGLLSGGQGRCGGEDLRDHAMQGPLGQARAALPQRVEDLAGTTESSWVIYKQHKAACVRDAHQGCGALEQAAVWLIQTENGGHAALCRTPSVHKLSWLTSHCLRLSGG